MSTRIAPASMIADATATLIAQIETCTRLTGERESYIRAASRAQTELIQGAHLERTEDGYRMPSRSRDGLTHYVSRELDATGHLRRYRCDCEAGLAFRACWHRCAALIADRITGQPTPPPTPAPAPYSPEELFPTLAQPRPRPIPTADRIAARRRAQQEMDELFPS